MTSITCNYCKKEYTNKYTLSRHQKSKVCFNKVILDNFNCIFCNKTLSSKQRILHHVSICDKNPNYVQPKKKESKKDNKYKELENEIQEIKKELSNNLKNNPIQQNITINNNNNNNNTDNSTKILNQTHNYGSILSLSKEVIKETFDKNYTLEDFFGSQKALADFTNKHFLRGKDNPIYLCTDKSRQKFVYTDEQHQETEDVNAEIMIKLMAKGFHKMRQLYDEEDSILQKRLKQFLKDDDMTNIVETRNQLKTLEDTYKQLLTIFKNGDKYRIQLSKILPSNVENRLINDERLKLSSDEDTYVSAELDRISKNKEKIDSLNEPVDEPLYYKTTRHIGGVTYGGLRLLKNHYIETGEKVYHSKHKNNIEYMKEFDKFCENDD
jgi:hypothetical protein